MLSREVVQGKKYIALSAVKQVGVVFLLVAMKVVALTRIRLTSQLRLNSLASGCVLCQQSPILEAMLLSEAVLSLMEWNSFLTCEALSVATQLLELSGRKWFAHGVVLSRRKPMHPHTDSTAAKRMAMHKRDFYAAGTGFANVGGRACVEDS
ncbi:hypothetical protein WK09_18075 [Burkholderia ubonensis]|nr:hypothetical protein WK09_18075 [Burkholderia ubonensis]KWE96474.1 hypothetical protein WL81_00005 [Burkholderia ubonensis]KWK02949.1 hypothetical protein WM12_28425 [Burkholderia ubonensis]KWK43880.1 hypothetical protein WM14_12750 [Burkholderia ubonensis]